MTGAARDRARPPRRPRPASMGVGGRLMLAQGLVLVAAIVTAGLVAIAVGPPLFHEHLLRAGHTADSPELVHIERAYRDASLVSLGVALAVSLGCAIAVTWYLTRRFQRALAALTGAAAEMERGHYHARVAVTGAGEELDTLASAFNGMAERLERTEQTRRRLLTDLAHELRTPIATLTAYVEGLGDGMATWDDRVAEVFVDQTTRLQRLAADLDAVSRAEEGRLALAPVPVRVADLVAAAVDAAAEAFAARGVRLVAGPVAEARVEADRARLGQVLANLLDNALRHTPPGGTVTVSASAGDQVRISVADDGDGIPAEQLPHVFERFFRGDLARDRDRAGSGVGLTISRAIVDAHGGALTATSPNPHGGATFTLTLPPSP